MSWEYRSAYGEADTVRNWGLWATVSEQVPRASLPQERMCVGGCGEYMGTLSWVGITNRMLHKFIPPSVGCGDEGPTRGWISFNVFLSFSFCSRLLSSQFAPLHDPDPALKSFVSCGNWYLVSKSRTMGFLPRSLNIAYRESPSSNWSYASLACSLVAFSSPSPHTYLLVLLLPSSSYNQYLSSLPCALWDVTAGRQHPNPPPSHPHTPTPLVQGATGMKHHSSWSDRALSCVQKRTETYVRKFQEPSQLTLGTKMCNGWFDQHLFSIYWMLNMT